jgi:hypothetical protein
VKSLLIIVESWLIRSKWQKFPNPPKICKNIWTLFFFVDPKRCRKIFTTKLKYVFSGLNLRWLEKWKKRIFFKKLMYDLFAFFQKNVVLLFFFDLYLSWTGFARWILFWSLFSEIRHLINYEMMKMNEMRNVRKSVH